VASVSSPCALPSNGGGIYSSLMIARAADSAGRPERPSIAEPSVVPLTSILRSVGAAVHGASPDEMQNLVNSGGSGTAVRDLEALAEEQLLLHRT